MFYTLNAKLTDVSHIFSVKKNGEGKSYAVNRIYAFVKIYSVRNITSQLV